MFFSTFSDRVWCTGQLWAALCKIVLVLESYSFIRENNTDPKAEYYIPTVVTNLIESKVMAVEVIPTNDSWFGVTYKEDKPMAVKAIHKQIEKGVYPKNLW